MQGANLVRIVHIYWQRRNQKSCLFQGELPQLSTLQFGLTTPMPGGSSRTYASCNTCCGLAYDITGLGSFTLWDPHWGIVHTQLLPIVCTYAPLHCQPQHQSAHVWLVLGITRPPGTLKLSQLVLEMSWNRVTHMQFRDGMDWPEEISPLWFMDSSTRSQSSCLDMVSTHGAGANSSHHEQHWSSSPWIPFITMY